MKHFLPVLLSLAIFAGDSVSASESGVPVNAPPAAKTNVCCTPQEGVKAAGGTAIDVRAAAPQPHQPDAVAVPETIGVSVLAGVSFLFMFGRRRYV